MNTADYCPEGREKYAEFMKWKDYATRNPWISVERVEKEAYRLFREHVDKCDICKRGGE